MFRVRVGGELAGARRHGIKSPRPRIQLSAHNGVGYVSGTDARTATSTGKGQVDRCTCRCTSLCAVVLQLPLPQRSHAMTIACKPLCMLQITLRCSSGVDCSGCQKSEPVCCPAWGPMQPLENCILSSAVTQLFCSTSSCRCYLHTQPKCRTPLSSSTSPPMARLWAASRWRCVSSASDHHYRLWARILLGQHVSVSERGQEHAVAIWRPSFRWAVVWALLLSWNRSSTFEGL